MALYLPISAPRSPGVRPARIDVIEDVISRWRARALGMDRHYVDGRGLPPRNVATQRVDATAQYEERWIAAQQAVQGDGRWYLRLPPLRRLRGWLGARLDRNIDLASLVGQEITFRGETVTVPSPVDLDPAVFGSREDPT